MISEDEYGCYLISNKPDYFKKISESILPEKLNYFDGKGYPSFSKLVNSCVHNCPFETVIIMSDKVLPTQDHVKKLINLINQGYGLVGLYRFAFFGFKKELFRTVGPLDERFIGGGYEDDDYYIRLKEANVSMYLSEEVPYFKGPSSWNYELSKPHFVRKWFPQYVPEKKIHENRVKRLLPEDNYNYNFGNNIPTKFLDWDKTFTTVPKTLRFTKWI